MKYRIGQGPWLHATLSGGDCEPSTTILDVSSDGIGAFVYSAVDQIGDVVHEGLELTWEYAEDGVTDADLVTVELYALEMVYVPTGDFYLGSGAASVGEFFRATYLPAVTDPYLVDGEGALSIGTSAGDLGIAPAAVVSATVPDTFPKGYAGYYCMKYETSQQQYVKFFNQQTTGQQDALDLSALGLCEISLFRNSFCYEDGEEATSAFPYVPISGLTAAQMLAYLDWTGLRPMTELEFEKACRGTLYPVEDEYAWGTTTLNTMPYQITNPDSTNEMVSNSDALPEANGNGVCSVNGLFASTLSLDGPIRIGGLAASGSRFTRLSSGGSYYGIMELSGNLSELVVTVKDAQGRSFGGAHGDGELTEDGLCGQNWPVTLSAFGSRGGNFLSLPLQLRVSDRLDAVLPLVASHLQGFRGVRTYPD